MSPSHSITSHQGCGWWVTKQIVHPSLSPILSPSPITLLTVSLVILTFLIHVDDKIGVVWRKKRREEGLALTSNEGGDGVCCVRCVLLRSTPCRASLPCAAYPRRAMRSRAQPCASQPHHKQLHDQMRWDKRMGCAAAPLANTLHNNGIYSSSFAFHIYLSLSFHSSSASSDSLE